MALSWKAPKDRQAHVLSDSMNTKFSMPTMAELRKGPHFAKRSMQLSRINHNKRRWEKQKLKKANADA